MIHLSRTPSTDPSLRGSNNDNPADKSKCTQGKKLKNSRGETRFTKPTLSSLKKKEDLNKSNQNSTQGDSLPKSRKVRKAGTRDAQSHKKKQLKETIKLNDGASEAATLSLTSSSQVTCDESKDDNRNQNSTQGDSLPKSRTRRKLKSGTGHAQRHKNNQVTMFSGSNTPKPVTKPLQTQEQTMVEKKPMQQSKDDNRNSAYWDKYIKELLENHRKQCKSKFDTDHTSNQQGTGAEKKGDNENPGKKIYKRSEEILKDHREKHKRQNKSDEDKSLNRQGIDTEKKDDDKSIESLKTDEKYTQLELKNGNVVKNDKQNKNITIILKNRSKYTFDYNMSNNKGIGWTKEDLDGNEI